MLLKTTGLTKTYTTSGHLITALDAVDLSFSENSFTCIVGKSGCGKTTLLRLLAGLEPAAAGTITYGNATKIGFVFQEPRLMPWLTVADNIAFAARNDTSLPKAPSEELLELLGLKEFRLAYPAQLSGGEQQRVSIARAIAKNPKRSYFNGRAFQRSRLFHAPQSSANAFGIISQAEKKYYLCHPRCRRGSAFRTAHFSHAGRQHQKRPDR